jgi:hypothetical protein
MNLLRASFLPFLFITVLVLWSPSVAGTAENIDDLVLVKDVVQCKECHKEKKAEWPKSGHAGSFSDMHVLRAFKKYIDTHESGSLQRAGNNLKETCLTCHAPQAWNASDKLMEEISGLIITAVDDKNSPAGQSALKELSKISIDCLACHMVYGMPEGEVEPNMIYGPGWDEDEEAHTRDHGFGTVGSPYLMSSKMCTRCHDDWPAGTPSLVLRMHRNSAKHIVEAEAMNKTCQECHMMEGERIIHDIPVFSGNPGFDIEQTADKVGIGLAVAAALPILLHRIFMEISPFRRREDEEVPDSADGEEVHRSLSAQERPLRYRGHRQHDQ